MNKLYFFLNAENSYLDRTKVDRMDESFFNAQLIKKKTIFALLFANDFLKFIVVFYNPTSSRSMRSRNHRMICSWC